MSAFSEMVEIKPLNDDKFKVVVETLRRIGVIERKRGERHTLANVIYLLHKQGKYYLAHYKQIEVLDCKRDKAEVNSIDIATLHQAVSLLLKWGLIQPLQEIDSCVLQQSLSAHTRLIVVKAKDKKFFNVIDKYNIGSYNA